MTVEEKYEEMTIDEYMAILNYDDRTEFLQELNRKVATGEITTEGELDNICLQDIRVNKLPPEVGKTFPLLRYTNGTPEMMGHTEVPKIDVSVVWIMITE